jgi:DNA-binding GntR family transcriptional regulator
VTRSTTAATSRRVAPDTAARRVERTLRRDIFNARLRAGTPLREVALAERFGVGRYTVRAALATLAADGLVQHTPNAGAQVRRLSEEDVADIYDVRRTLEFAAVALIGRRRPSLDRVRRAADRLEALERVEQKRRSPHWGALDADLEFHRVVVEAAGSPRLSRAYATLLAELRLGLAQLAAVAELVPGGHRPLYTALEAGDAGKARRWISDHIREAAGSVIEALRATSTSSP